MAYRTGNPYLFRLSAKMVIFGMWIVFFGLLILYFSIQMMSALSGVDFGLIGAGQGLGIDGMMVDGTVALYQGGFITLGLGSFLMTFGSMFIISVSR